MRNLRAKKVLLIRKNQGQPNIVKVNIRKLCISEPEGEKPEMTMYLVIILRSHDTFSLRICLHPRGISPAGAAGHQFALHYLSGFFSSQRDKDIYAERE
jgi:hypothetical protein